MLASSRVDRHIFDDRQHAFLTDTFHHLLIHGDGGAEHARAHVGQVGQFEQALHGAIFAEGAVQHGEDHVDFRVRAGLGQDRARAPLAVLVDKVFDRLVLLGIQAGHDRLGRAHRDFVLAGASAVDDGYS